MDGVKEVRDVFGPEGELIERCEYLGDDRHGKYEGFNTNGTLVCFYECGKLHRPYESMWRDGTIYEKGMARRGKKHGPWITE